MRRLALTALISTLLVAGTAPGRAADIPPLNERDLATFLAIEKALVADAERAAEFCALDLNRSDDDSPPDPDGARLGRKLDAHPYFGPVLRRHSISGQRFAQVAAQVAAGALGLAMADSFDDTARSKGEPATNRSALLEKSADTRLVAAHLEEITAVLTKAGAICEGGRGSDADEEPEDDESEDGGL